MEVDILVTSLLEINGELVAYNQLSDRIVTLPTSVVLSSHVHNFSREGVPFAWNDLSVQVFCESDLQFVRQVIIDVADDSLGDEMARNVTQNRHG